MQSLTWRSHVLQITEHTAGNKPVEYLFIKRALAFICNVVNGEAGHYYIKHTEIRQWFIQIVSLDRDGRVSGETLSRKLQHRRREIDPNSFYLRPQLFGDADKPTRASSNVQNACCFGRQMFQYRIFAPPPMGNAIPAR